MKRIRRQQERAQAMVEFAIVAPMLFTVVIGMMIMGITFGKHLDVKGATRDGARRAAVSMAQDNPVAITEQTVRDQLALSDGVTATVTVTPPPPWNHGDRVTVRTTVPHQYGFMGLGWSGNLRAQSTIRVE